MNAVQPYIPGFEGEERRRDLSQFYTPPDLALRFWKWMHRTHTRLRVLEPSAGRGALLQPLLDLGVSIAGVVAYEVDPHNVQHLAERFHSVLPIEIRARDFLADPEPGRFNMCVMNTPFEDDQDIDFAEHALNCCAWVGGIFPARVEFSAGRDSFWRWTDIKRKVVLTARPSFGGDYSPMTDFVLLELQRRESARLQGEATTMTLERW